MLSFPNQELKEQASLREKPAKRSQGLGRGPKWAGHDSKLRWQVSLPDARVQFDGKVVVPLLTSPLRICSLRAPQAAELQDKAQDFSRNTLGGDGEDWEKETRKIKEKLGRRDLSLTAASSEQRTLHMPQESPLVDRVPYKTWRGTNSSQANSSSHMPAPPSAT